MIARETLLTDVILSGDFGNSIPADRTCVPLSVIPVASVALREDCSRAVDQVLCKAVELTMALPSRDTETRGIPHNTELV